jgi:hypothetical protein
MQQGHDVSEITGAIYHDKVKDWIHEVEAGIIIQPQSSNAYTGCLYFLN